MYALTVCTCTVLNVIMVSMSSGLHALDTRTLCQRVLYHERSFLVGLPINVMTTSVHILQRMLSQDTSPVTQQR